MTLFKNQIHQELWLDHWCERCVSRIKLEAPEQQCPILAKALRTQRKPPQWERPHKAALMKDTYKCNEFRLKPQRFAREPQQFEDVGMFEVEPQERKIVPVEGWPDRPRKGKDVDHA